MQAGTPQHETGYDIRPTPKARATVSVVGRYAAYHLIEELAALGDLRRAYVAHRLTPRVPRELVNNNWLLGCGKLVAGRYLRLGPDTVGYWADRLFDQLVARAIRRDGSGEDRVFHGLASFCRDSLPVARSLGYTTFVDRACPHIDFQQELLQEEHARYGLPYPESWRAARDVMTEEYERADYIVVPSRYSYRSFIERGFDPAKVRIVPLGATTSDKPVHRRPDGPFRVLYVGTGVRKGLIDMLAAWRELDLPGAELLIRTDVPSTIAHMAEHPSIRRIGYLSRADLLELFAQATVFCYPSIDDGFAMVLTEAMGHGLPVITTSQVGASDLIQEGEEGFVVPIRSPSRIAERIEFFYRNREAASVMGRKAAAKALQYSWSRYGQSMTELYDDVLNRSVGASRDSGVSSTAAP